MGINGSDLPVWVREIFERLVDTVEFMGMAYLESRYWPAGEVEEWDQMIVLEIAPAVMEVEGGENDGENTYGLILRVDMLAVQALLDEIDTLDFGLDEGVACMTMLGKKGGEEVVMIIRSEPFEDAEVSAIMGAGGIRFREKGSDEDEDVG